MLVTKPWRHLNTYSCGANTQSANIHGASANIADRAYTRSYLVKPPANDDKFEELHSIQSPDSQDDNGNALKSADAREIRGSSVIMPCVLHAHDKDHVCHSSLAKAHSCDDLLFQSPTLSVDSISQHPLSYSEPWDLCSLLQRSYVGEMTDGENGGRLCDGYTSSQGHRPEPRAGSNLLLPLCREDYLEGIDWEETIV